MIYYVGAYRTKNIEEREPQGSAAEDAKIAYIISIIKSLENEVKVVSVLASLKRGFHGRKVCKVDELETQVFLESYDETRRGLSKIGVLQRLMALFFYLLFNVKRTDTVLVYNTQLYSVPVRLAKWFKHFKMVLEVEEIFYMDERNPADVKRKPLEEALIHAADAYVTASALLAQRIAGNKPSAVVYGGYTIPPKYADRLDDNKIHVVYAGGIDSLRRVDRAVRAFEFLPEQYRFHILGFGSTEDIKKLNADINEVNTKAGIKKVEYVGCLSGKEYDEYLQKCHIGLNMQSIGASIETVAFPSKISSYMSRGLDVVSGSLESILHSPLAEGITFYQDNSEQSIAKAILMCKRHTCEEQIELIKKAEKEFVEKFQKIV